MKSFLDPDSVAEIKRRISNLQPETVALWGKMNAGQMICHLTDSYLGVMGIRPIQPAHTLVSRTLMKWVALHVPMPWPRGMPTRPEVDQQQSGTPPGNFDADKTKLLALVERFATQPRDFNFTDHPIMGTLSIAEWMRWGYLHADHHLRQFGL